MRTMSPDTGKAFAAFAQLKHKLAVMFHFADPHAPGSAEPTTIAAACREPACPREATSPGKRSANLHTPRRR